MTGWVRVKDPATGHHLTVTQRQAEMFGGVVLKDHAAVDELGRPLPPKYNNRVAAGPAAAEQKKEG